MHTPPRVQALARGLQQAGEREGKRGHGLDGERHPGQPLILTHRASTASAVADGAGASPVTQACSSARICAAFP